MQEKLFCKSQIALYTGEHRNGQLDYEILSQTSFNMINMKK